LQAFRSRRQFVAIWLERQSEGRVFFTRVADPAGLQTITHHPGSSDSRSPQARCEREARAARACVEV